MNYESYVFEDDFNTRRNMIVPLIVNEMVNQEWKKNDWKIFYDRYYYKEKYNHKDAKIASKNQLENMIKEAKELLTPHINELIDNLTLGQFLYYGEKHLKSKLFMLRYMVFLTDLEDRIMFYDTYTNKREISKKIIKKVYWDIIYKFSDLRLPYTRKEQDEYHKNQGLYSIDYLDDLREKQGLYTRRQLTEKDVKVNPCDLFIKVLPEVILQKNTLLKASLF